MSLLLRCTAASVFLLASSFSHAGTIDALSVSASGPGLGTVVIPIITTVDPGNDDVPTGSQSNNVTVPIKRFQGPGYIDITFDVTDNGSGSGTDVTEYFFFESVDNDTGVDWIGYTMMLGTLSGSTFIPASGSDALDFDSVAAASADVTSSAFASITPNATAHALSFSGGTHSSGAETFSFSIDIPDGIGSFTLRQIPILVPEPTSAALLGLAGLTIAGYLRRK